MCDESSRGEIQRVEGREMWRKKRKKEGKWWEGRNEIVKGDEWVGREVLEVVCAWWRVEDSWTRAWKVREAVNMGEEESGWKGVCVRK